MTTEQESPPAWEIIRAAEETGLAGLTVSYLSEGDRKITEVGLAFVRAVRKVLQLNCLKKRIILERATFNLGDIVRKRSGSKWAGRVVGTYSTTLTPEGYAVESDAHAGSVQIYPVGALELELANAYIIF